MKILIVDDAASERDAAVEQLAVHGHALTIVRGFTDARRLLEKRMAFDVILTDLMMPCESPVPGPYGEMNLGKMMPYGLILALMAKKDGVPKVAIVSHGDTHMYPMFWTANLISGEMMPGLWAFTDFLCPTKENADGPAVKEWSVALSRMTTGENA